ncbi:hypothetical protein P7D22_19660 [Lichenihabitans sp. Uapishka_5]|uniref:hypothetical protein n=1 Tax=Lichenihabitans sp. Uapishka_5 TaxID=3037302 RepID=UPI0029E7E8D1|nr:hypothetical protein [Lichenihabitans sp. Uapishka_5]MDX7953385.1 hypothetical protein [Lichenihabitans sp. Uapishka_5]
MSAPFSVPQQPVTLAELKNLQYFATVLRFAPSAVGTATVTFSNDGGSTFAPFTAGSRVISARSATTSLTLLSDSSLLYRLECSMTAGSINYEFNRGAYVGNMNTPSLIDNWQTSLPMMLGNISDTIPVGQTALYFEKQSLFSANGNTPPTAAQTQKLLQTIFTPMLDTDLQGTLTGYVAASYGTIAADGSYTASGNAIVTLSIPSQAPRARAANFRLGRRRLIAQYVDVVSVVDANGNALNSAFSFTDPPAKLSNGTKYAGTVFAPNTRVTVQSSDGTAAASLFAQSIGINFSPTMIEAATAVVPVPSAQTPNLTALGL